VLDIAVVRGRPFARDERTSAHAVAIVSETTARALWPNADPVGQVVRLDPDSTQETQGAAGPALESRTFEVVGVARDVAGFRVAPTPKAVVYLPTNTEAPFTSLVVRVHGDPDRARQALINRLATIDPTMDQVGTMRSMTRIETYFLELGFWSTVGLGGLALALTLSGLFSVLSYLVEQRRKEIGVRMALGATPSNVIRLVLSQSIRPVGIGLIVGSVSDRVCRQPAPHPGRVPARRLDSRDPRRSPRPDADASPGIVLRAVRAPRSIDLVRQNARPTRCSNCSNRGSARIES
jgi:hypothetical protein